MAERGIEWLAGLLEGEGCFSMTHGQSGPKTPMISLGMTDWDVMLAAQVILATIGGRTVTLRGRTLASAKVVYTLQLTGLPAAKVMLAVHAYMGARRAAKIQTVLALWNPTKYKEAVEWHATHLKGVMPLLPFQG